MATPRRAPPPVPPSYVPAHNRVAERSGGEYPRWVFGRFDWSWARLEVHNLPDAAACSGLLKALRHFERMTWGEIEAESDHTHPVAFGDDAGDEVYARFQRVVHGEEPPPLWQLDIGGYEGHGREARLFGLRIGEVFEILWYDPYHRVFPMNVPD